MRRDNTNAVEVKTERTSDAKSVAAVTELMQNVRVKKEKEDVSTTKNVRSTTNSTKNATKQRTTDGSV